MTWFGPAPEAPHDLPAEGAALERGVRLERRAVLMGVLGGALALGARGQDRAATPAPTAAADPLAAFLERAGDLAREFFAGEDGNEEAYLHRLVALLAELPSVPTDAWAGEELRGSWGMKRAGSRKLGAGEGRYPSLSVFQMKFKPDAVIPIHDHFQYAGAVVVLEGEVRARNFDLVQGSRESDAVQVQETCDALLLPGRFSTLATGRHNFHELRAGPQGARAIDVFTFFEGAKGSRYLELDEKAPADAARRVFDGRWR